MCCVQSSLPPPPFIGEDIAVLGARPWLGHHIGDRVTPGTVVCGRLVLAGGRLGSVDLDKDKPLRIITLLDDVKTCDAGLLHAVPRVLKRCRPKGFHTLWLDVNMH